MSYFLVSCFKRRLNVRVLAMEYPGYGLYGYEEKDSDQLLQNALHGYVGDDSSTTI